MALSRCPKLCPNRPSPTAFLLNIITGINIRSPDRSEVVKKTRAITLVAPGCLRAAKSQHQDRYHHLFLPTSLYKMANKSNKSRALDLFNLLFFRALIFTSEAQTKKSITLAR
jgi:hypothetical protein